MKPILISVLIACFMVSCSSGSDPIAFGQDQCRFCKMTIADPKFGAELITDKGRIFKYDAAECLIHHLEDGAPPYEELLVIAYDKPHQLYPVNSLRFVISPAYRSPMGANLAAFSEINAIQPADRSLAIPWDQVRDTLSTP